MKREEIVQEFLKKELLLTKEALDFLENRDVGEFLGREYKSTVLTEADMTPNIRIVKNLTSKPHEATTEDFLRYYTSKYDKLRKIILERLPKDYMSLNKIDASRNEVHVIGIVRDKKQSGEKIVIELEDPTGTVSVVFDPKEKNLDDIDQDDVIAVKATAAGKVIYGKQIMFPDAPLRQPTKGSGRACFLSDVTDDTESVLRWMETQDISTLFVTGKIDEIKKFEELVDKYCANKDVIVCAVKDEFPSLAEQFRSRKIVSVSNPGMVEVAGIKVLLVGSADIQKIKKRYIGKSKTILAEDYLVMEDVPDIVHHATKEPTIQNYKSITLVSAGSRLAKTAPVVIDFATREASFIDKFK